MESRAVGEYSPKEAPNPALLGRSTTRGGLQRGSGQGPGCSVLSGAVYIYKIYIVYLQRQIPWSACSINMICTNHCHRFLASRRQELDRKHFLRIAPSLFRQRYRLMLWYKQDYVNCLLKFLKGNREYLFGSHCMSKGCVILSKKISPTKIQAEVLEVPTSLLHMSPASLPERPTCI